MCGYLCFLVSFDNALSYVINMYPLVVALCSFCRILVLFVGRTLPLLKYWGFPSVRAPTVPSFVHQRLYADFVFVTRACQQARGSSTFFYAKRCWVFGLKLGSVIHG